MTDSAKAARGGNSNHPNHIVCATQSVFWSSGFWLRAQTDLFERTHGTSPFAAQPNVRTNGYRYTISLYPSSHGA